MQNARRVQSEEARGHLNNAHHRVMSIAEVQRQLSVSKGGKVAPRAYLTQLCQSLGASMVADEDRLSIVVAVDNSIVDAEASVSLGLIVTELVINALKHAFPDQPSGKIRINYHSTGPMTASGFPRAGCAKSRTWNRHRRGADQESSCRNRDH
jgi:two-component sensor histidine kinase